MKYLFLAAFLVADPVNAGAERTVSIEEATLRASKQSVAVTLRRQPEGKFEIEVEFYGKTTTVRADDLPEVRSVSPETGRIVTHTPTSALETDWLRDKGFILSFDYGELQDHGSDDNYVLVRSRCRLHFGSDGQFYKADFLVPAGDFKNEWELFEKLKGEKATKNGTAKGVKPPML